MIDFRKSSRSGVALTVAFLAMAISLLALQAGAVSPFDPPRVAAQSGGTWHTIAHGDDVRAIAVQGGTVWAGTAGGGLVSWNTAAETYEQLLHPQEALPGNSIQDVAIDSAGNLWVATDRGLGKRTPGGAWTTYDMTNTQGKLSSNDVTAVAVGSGDVIWIGMAQFWDGNQWTGGGVARLQNNQWTAYTIQDGLASANVTDIAIDAGGDVWVTMAQYRLLVSNSTTDESTWANQKGGISRFHSGAWNSYQHQDGDASAYPRTDNLHAVSIDKEGRKWFATDGRGLEVLEDESTWYEFRAEDNRLAGDWVLAVSVDSDDKVWAATESRSGSTRSGRGVSILDHKGTLSNTSDDAWRTLKTGDGLPSDSIRAVVAVTPDLAWFGASDPAGDGFGLVRYQSGALKTFSTTDDGGLPSNMITAMAFDLSNRVWVGTASRGVAVFDGNTWKRYTAENTNGELSNDLVRAIAVDDDNKVWVALDGSKFDNNAKRYTDGGVSVFDGTEWHRYTLEDTATVGDTVTEVQANTGAGESLISVGFADEAEANDKLPSHYLVFEGDDTLYSFLQYDNQNKAILIAPPLAKGISAGTAVKAVHVGLAENRALSIGNGLGKVWIGTGSLRLHEGSGLSVYDTQAREWNETIVSPTLPSDVVTGIDFQGDTVWVAATNKQFAGGGVGRGESGGTSWTTFDSETGGLVICKNDVRSIAVDHDDNVWAGGFSGPGNTCGTLNWPLVDAAVNRWHNNAWQHWLFEDDGYVSALAVDKQGRVWLGTSRDGQTPADVKPQNRYSPVGGARLFSDNDWLVFNPDNSGIASNDIRGIAISSNGERWFATYRSGISILGQGDPPIPATATPLPDNTATPLPSPTGQRSPTPILPGVSLLTTPMPTPTDLPPSQVPEANSLWLLSSGLASLAGYAALRTMARRR